jgi:hypothetical protein
MIFVVGREGRTTVVAERDVDGVAVDPTVETKVPRSDGASRRVRLRLARTGNACAKACLTTDARIGLFDRGARLPAVVFGRRSPRSHTDNGAENGKRTSAINQQAAVRAASESDMFV